MTTPSKYFESKSFSARRLQKFCEDNVPDKELSRDYYDYLIKKCYSPVFYSSSIVKRKAADDQFIDDLKLCWRLFRFIDDIRYYPEWTRDSARKSAPFTFKHWHSSVVGGSVQCKRWSDSDIAAIFGDKFKLNDDDQVLEYVFHNHIMIVYPFQIDFNKYYPIIITKNNMHNPEVLLAAKIYYQNNFTDEYCHYKLEDFREDDDWVLYLLDIMYRVRRDELRFTALYRQYQHNIKDKPAAWYEIEWSDCRDIITGD